MGEILGMGVTHYPALAGRDEYMAGILKGSSRTLDCPTNTDTPRVGRRRCGRNMAQMEGSVRLDGIVRAWWPSSERRDSSWMTSRRILW